MNLSISEDPSIGAEAAGLLDRLNSQADSLNADCAKLESDVARVKSTPATAMGEKEIELARGVPARRLDLMRRELAIRNQLGSKFFPVRNRDRVAYTEKTMEEHTQSQEKVRKALVGIGYSDDIIPGSNTRWINPGMINMHPAVIAARERYESAHSLSCVRTDDERMNEEAINAIVVEMEKIKQRAMSAVA